MSEISLIKIMNPLDRRNREISTIPYKGENLLEIRRAFLPEEISFVISVNGQIVSEEMLAATTVRNGDCLVFTPEATGDDVMQILKIAAVIIVMAVVSYYMPATWPMWAKVLTVMAATTATSLTLNYLIPPPKAKIPTMDLMDAESSQVYSWNPQTVQQQGLAIPHAYGTNRLYGNIIGAYIENENDRQFINVLISLGRGPFKRLWDYKLNDQPIENLKAVEIHSRLGHLGQAVIPNFYDTKVEYFLSNKIVKDSPYIYTTIRNDFDGLEIDVSFPQGLWYSNDQGGLDPYQVDFRIKIKKVGESNWMTLTRQAITSVVKEYKERWSLGEWIHSFNMLYENSEYIWSEITYGSTDPYAHYDGENQPGTSYFWRWIAGDTERVVSTDVDYLSVKANLSNSIRRTIKAGHLSHGQYEIHVENLTADQTTIRYGDDLYVSSVREVFYDGQEYPREVLVGIRALATDQLSGSLRFSCLSEGRQIRVWDGANWSVQFSKSPAWVLWDILTQPVFDNSLNVLRYDGIQPERLILADFKALADHLSAQVPDGVGGYENRVMFNGVFDAGMSLWEAVLLICQEARCIPIYYGNQIGLAIDKPSSPVQLFNMGNLKPGTFKQSFLPLQERATEIEVSYRNSENDYKRETFLVYDKTQNKQMPPANLSLIGCTKPSEAWRQGMLRLNGNQAIKRAVEFDADIDAIACMIGDVIYIQHDVPQWGFGSRIVSATASSITIDQEAIIEAGKTYKVKIRFSTNDTIEERTVSNSPGTYTTLTVSSPFSATPAKHDLYWFGELTAKPFRVLDTERSQDMAIKIFCLEYNESIYGSDTLEPLIATPNYSSLKSIAPVTALRAEERLIKDRSGIRTVIDVYFQVPRNVSFSHAEIWYSAEGSGWKFAGNSPFGPLRVENVFDAVTYQIKAVAVNTLGQRESFDSAPTMTLYIWGKTLPPDDVPSFWGEAGHGGLKLSWDPVDDVDLDYYEIRWHPNSDVGTWENALLVAEVRGTSLSLPAALSGIYYNKAVDTSGNKSQNAIGVITTIPAIYSWNVQETLTENPDFTGAKEKMVILSGDLYLDLGGASFNNIEDFDAVSDLDGYGAGEETIGYYETTPVDLATVQTARCYGKTVYYGVDKENLFNDILNFDIVPNLDGKINEISLTLQIALSQDGSSWGGWMPFLVGDYVARAFKFRARAESRKSTQLLYIDELEFIVDMPERSEKGRGLSVDAAGTNVIFGKIFMVRPIVATTIHSASAGDTIRLTSLSESGFTVQILDSGGNGVARTIDWEAVGY